MVSSVGRLAVLGYLALHRTDAERAGDISSDVHRRGGNAHIVVWLPVV